jgi:hypothetical protein
MAYHSKQKYYYYSLNKFSGRSKCQEKVEEKEKDKEKQGASQKKLKEFKKQKKIEPVGETKKDMNQKIDPKFRNN